MVPVLPEPFERVKPPPELTDEEVEVWVKVVAGEAPDWFGEGTVPLLAQYCRHVVSAKRVAELIERATGDKNLSIMDYERLLGLQARESRVLASLASRMRIAQQATINHNGNKRPVEARKPWQG